MASQDEQSNQPPIIVVKKIKKGGHAHHGGAWKVAYADFVTAMMAFFLLLWLLSATTEEQKRGIADYFAPMNVSRSTTGSDGVLGGRTVTADGAMSHDAGAPAVTVALPAPEPKPDSEAEGDKQPNEDEIEKALAAREEQQFEEVQDALKQAIQKVPELRDLENSLIVDQTPEGLRIQIVDQEGRSMFPSGSAAMYDQTKALIALVADAIRQLPQQIAIRGHTDAQPYKSDSGYSNWELSSDRANSSRRQLLEAGLPAERIASVTGQADREPLVTDDPYSPRNRRISIILLRERPRNAEAEAKVESTDG
ncbi:MAG: flagellar motor protein MotB [Kiloniellales bacterium]